MSANLLCATSRLYGKAGAFHARREQFQPLASFPPAINISYNFILVHPAAFFYFSQFLSQESECSPFAARTAMMRMPRNSSIDILL